VLDLVEVGRIGDTVVNARQVDTEVVTAVQDDGVIGVFNEDHVLGTTPVHAAEADDFQARAVVDDVGTLRFAIGIGRHVLAGDALGVLLAAALGTHGLAARGGQTAGHWRFALPVLGAWAAAAAFLVIVGAALAVPRTATVSRWTFRSVIGIVIVFWLHYLSFLIGKDL
jgi:hypothetical protein